MEALSLKATAKKNANVLQHAMGYFKKVLSPRREAGTAGSDRAVPAGS